MDRSSGALYALAAGIVFLFYVGPYRTAATRVQLAKADMAQDRSVVAEDRAILQRATALQALQKRVSDALHSPVQAGTFGSDEASFLDRLRRLAKRNNVAIVSLVQGARSSAGTDSAVFKSRPLHISATGGFSSILQFLGSLGSTVGIFAIERIDMQPLPTAPQTKGGVRIRLDGSAIQIMHGKER